MSETEWYLLKEERHESEQTGVRGDLKNWKRDGIYETGWWRGQEATTRDTTRSERVLVHTHIHTRPYHSLLEYETPILIGPRCALHSRFHIRNEVIRNPFSPIDQYGKSPLQLFIRLTFGVEESPHSYLVCGCSFHGRGEGKDFLMYENDVSNL